MNLLLLLKEIIIFFSVDKIIVDRDIYNRFLIYKRKLWKFINVKYIF